MVVATLVVWGSTKTCKLHPQHPLTFPEAVRWVATPPTHTQLTHRALGFFFLGVVSNPREDPTHDQLAVRRMVHASDWLPGTPEVQRGVYDSRAYELMHTRG